MTPLFSRGEMVIDTKRKVSATVVAVIEGTEIVYVLEDNYDDLYMEKESNLIEYDKYYFDKKEPTEVKEKEEVIV